jgi:hypothetical protein
MMVIFLGAATAVPLSLIAAILLGGWQPLAVLALALCTMWAVAKYEEAQKRKAVARCKTAGYNPPVWGA